jgi:hypothetical protein
MPTSPWWSWKVEQLQTPAVSPTPVVTNTGAGDGTVEHPAMPATAVSALRVVSWVSETEVGYTDPSNAMSVKSIAGITKTAGALGGSVPICGAGFVSDNSWNWTVGANVLCGPSGVLTQTWNPAWSHVVVVGYAITAKTLLVKLRDSIKQG